jgi:hypothetical protein
MIDFFIFKIRFHLYIAFKKLTQPKRNDYILFLFGKFPDNFKHGMNAILDANSKVRFSLSSTCIVVRFDSIKKIKDVELTLSKIYRGYSDTFFIFNENNQYGLMLNEVQYGNLYDPNFKHMVPNEALEHIGSFIKTIQELKDKFINMMVHEPIKPTIEIYNTDDNTITMDDIDPILDKIEKYGLNSLTEQEKLILKKYTDK